MVKNSILNSHERRKFPSYIKKLEFDALAIYKDVFCVSILVGSKDKDSDLGSKIIQEFQNQFHIPGNELNHQGLDEKVILLELRNHSDFIKEWVESNNDASLTIFISSKTSEIFLSKTNVSFRVYINDHFYLKPIASYFNPVDKDVDSILRDQTDFETEIDRIIKETENGNVKAVFLSESKDIYGEYDEKNEFLLLDEESKKNSISNLVAVKTNINNGNVYILPKSKMPIKEKQISAIIKK